MKCVPSWFRQGAGRAGAVLHMPGRTAAAVHEDAVLSFSGTHPKEPLLESRASQCIKQGIVKPCGGSGRQGRPPAVRRQALARPACQRRCKAAHMQASHSSTGNLSVAGNQAAATFAWHYNACFLALAGAAPPDWHVDSQANHKLLSSQSNIGSTISIDHRTLACGMPAATAKI